MFLKRLIVVLRRGVRFLCLTFVVIASSSKLAAQERPVLVWTNPVLPPWLYHDERGAYTGLLYDIMSIVAARLDVDLVVKEVPMRRTYTDLVELRADVSIIPGSTGKSPVQYLSEVAVSPQALFTTNLVLVGLNSMRFDGDFGKYRIGGWNLPPEVRESFVGSEAEWVGMVSSKALVKGLITQRIDLAFDTRTTIMYSAKQLGVAQRISTVYVFDQKGVFHFAWSKSANAERLRAGVEGVVADMKMSGELAGLVAKYGDVNDYGF